MSKDIFKRVLTKMTKKQAQEYSSLSRYDFNNLIKSSEIVNPCYLPGKKHPVFFKEDIDDALKQSRLESKNKQVKTDLSDLPLHLQEDFYKTLHKAIG